MTEKTHIDLDVPETYGTVDPGGVYSYVHDFPDEINAASNLCVGFDPPGSWAGTDKIIVLGMGGSGIAGRVLSAYVNAAGGALAVTDRGYDIPEWVDERTLALAVSYSGNTAETLSAVAAAIEKGAKLFAVTSGGKLEKLAENHSFPYIKIPGGRLPRHSLGYLVVPLFECLNRASLIATPPLDAVVDITIRRREDWGADVPAAKNPVKQTAAEIYDNGYFPVIYGVGDVGAVAAERTRGQLAEDSKLYASSHFFPELCHNEVVGYEGNDERLADFYVIVYRSPDENRTLTKQTDAALEIIGREVAKVREIKATATDALPTLFEFIYFGDFLGYYMALLRGVNPESVRSIVELKERTE
jgi:glucose/mannose-6-phosphate isomerase